MSAVVIQVLHACSGRTLNAEFEALLQRNRCFQAVRSQTLLLLFLSLDDNEESPSPSLSVTCVVS